MAEKEMAKKKEAFKQGRTLGISGREVFLFNPELVRGDEDNEEGEGVLQVELTKEEVSKFICMSVLRVWRSIVT